MGGKDRVKERDKQAWTKGWYLSYNTGQGTGQLVPANKVCQSLGPGFLKGEMVESLR